MIQTRTIGSLTEIYVGGGNFMTQAFPTNFHSFYKRKVLTSSESVNDFKEVSDAEKSEIEESDSKWAAPSEDFIALCESYGAVYNHKTGFFELNGLVDITEEQMRDIVVAGPLELPYPQGYGGNIRTNLLSKTITNVGCANDRKPNLAHIFRSNREIEVIRIGIDGYSRYPIVAESIYLFATGCLKLKKILGVISLRALSNYAGNRDAFTNCPLLEEVKLAELKIDYNFSTNPLLSLASFRYMVDNAINTSAITLTVHADTYAKLTGDTTNAAAAALTPEELAQWQQLMTDATAKNISFIEATT